jgi:myo-inositol-1(or 4)-monophosphatase
MQKKDNTMSTPSPAELTFVAIQAALSAGTLLRQGFGTEFEIELKQGKQNLVTEYDKSSEKSIISTIFQHFPGHAILAEESGEMHKGQSPVTWIIDPLDGTVNFARHIPVFSVSIAVAIDKQIVSGVVYQPITRELFIAEIKKGAYLNGKRIYVSKITEFENTLMATGFPYDVDKNPFSCIDRFAKLQAQGIPIRRLGSAAIDLCYVAAGKFDTFWEVGLHPWDMAAGKLLVEEAGGQVTHWDGSPHKVFSYDTLLASNGLLHQKMIEQLK